MITRRFLHIFWPSAIFLVVKILSFGVFLLFGAIHSLAQGDKAPGLSLDQLLSHLKDGSAEQKLIELEQNALVHQIKSLRGPLLPELGIELGQQATREEEMQDKNSPFYYFYVRYQLKLDELYQFHARKAELSLAQLKISQSQARVEWLAAGLFFQTLSLQQQIQFKKEDFEMGRAQIQAAEKRVQGGIATETDLIEFQMHQQEIQNDLLTMTSRLREMLRELSRMAGRDPDAIKQLHGDFLHPASRPSFDELWSEVLKFNPELNHARFEIHSAEAQRKAAHSQWLPTLSVEARAGRPEKREHIRADQYNWEVIGKVTLPLFAGFRHQERYRQSALEYVRAQVAEDLTLSKARLAVKSTLDRLEQLEAKISGEKRNIALAQRYYRAVMDEYQRGVRNSRDLASATDQLFAAQNRLLEARKDLSLGVIELKSLTGEPLSSLTSPADNSAD